MKSSFSTSPDIFKPLLKCSIFKCISWLNGSFFCFLFFGWTSGFSERGSQDLYRMAPMSPLNTPTIFVCTSIVYMVLRYKCIYQRLLTSLHVCSWRHDDTHRQILMCCFVPLVNFFNCFVFEGRQSAKGFVSIAHRGSSVVEPAAAASSLPSDCCRANIDTFGRWYCPNNHQVQIDVRWVSGEGGVLTVQHEVSVELFIYTW